MKLEKFKCLMGKFWSIVKCWSTKKLLKQTEIAIRNFMVRPNSPPKIQLIAREFERAAIKLENDVEALKKSRSG